MIGPPEGQFNAKVTEWYEEVRQRENDWYLQNVIPRIREGAEAVIAYAEEEARRVEALDLPLGRRDCCRTCGWLVDSHCHCHTDGRPRGGIPGKRENKSQLEWSCPDYIKDSAERRAIGENARNDYWAGMHLCSMGLKIGGEALIKSARRRLRKIGIDPQ